MDITTIKNQRLSTLLTDYCECESCHIVDRDPNRSKRGSPCPRCGVKGDGGEVYFHMGIRSSIDLMQELYHTPSRSGTGLGHLVASHHLAVIVFFCTMVESLIENLLREIMIAQDLPSAVQERLLSDNLTSKQRVDKLFPTLVDEKWNDAISAAIRAHQGKRTDIKAALDFFLKAVRARNRFLHPPGNKWAIGLDMPRQCLRQTPTLLVLFVWLHNRCVAKVKPT